jgi:hypothetical protein
MKLFRRSRDVVVICALLGIGLVGIALEFIVRVGFIVLVAYGILYLAGIIT